MSNNNLKKDFVSSWLHIDATNLVVGRLGTAEISKILRGKNKTCYTPNKLVGDYVVVTNAKKIKFTGAKLMNKQYFRAHWLSWWNKINYTKRFNRKRT